MLTAIVLIVALAGLFLVSWVAEVERRPGVLRERPRRVADSPLPLVRRSMRRFGTTRVT
jgi:hypothetical protein